MVINISLSHALSLFLRWSRADPACRTSVSHAWLRAASPPGRQALSLLAALSPQLDTLPRPKSEVAADAAVRAVVAAATRVVLKAMQVRGAQESKKLEQGAHTQENIEDACVELLHYWGSQDGDSTKPDDIFGWSEGRTGAFLRTSVRRRLVDIYRARTGTRRRSAKSGPSGEEISTGDRSWHIDAFREPQIAQVQTTVFASSSAEDGDEREHPPGSATEHFDPEAVRERVEFERQLEAGLAAMIHRFGEVSSIPSGEDSGGPTTPAGIAQLADYRVQWRNDLLEAGEIIKARTTVKQFHTAANPDMPATTLAALVVSRTRAYSRARDRLHAVATLPDSPLFEPTMPVDLRVSILFEFDERHRFKVQSESVAAKRTQLGTKK